MRTQTKTASPSAEDGHKLAKQQYIITQTLNGVLHSFKAMGLKTPAPDRIAKCEESLLEGVKVLFKGEPGVEVTSIPMEEQCDKISTTVHKVRKSSPKATIVSTAPLLSFENGGVCIEMSRIVDLQGRILGIGSRPGHPSVSRQLAQYHQLLEEQPVIIAEDGSFTGSSLQYLITELQKRRARIQAVVLGILFPKAEEAIRKVYKGEIVACYNFSNPVDWMPSHDFTPFMPNSGRVVGFKMGTNAFPIHLSDGASVCMPYILPYGRPYEWASLPQNEYGLRRFSLLCLHLVHNLFEEMEGLNGKDILISDVWDSTPRTSIPVSPVSSSLDGPLDFSEIHERITRLLDFDMELFS